MIFVLFKTWVEKHKCLAGHFYHSNEIYSLLNVLRSVSPVLFNVFHPGRVCQSNLNTHSEPVVKVQLVLIHTHRLPGPRGPSPLSAQRPATGWPSQWRSGLHSWKSRSRKPWVHNQYTITFIVCTATLRQVYLWLYWDTFFQFMKVHFDIH